LIAWRSGRQQITEIGPDRRLVAHQLRSPTTRRTILLVRHGETEWNRVRRYQGWSDSPLTERGIAQAQAIGRLLSTLAGTISAELVASPIGRARHTPGIFDGEGHYEWYFRTPDGETYEAFTSRIGDWLGSTGDRFIIVVTHGIVTRVLRGLYAGLPRTAALRLPVPQDRVFRLAEGTIDEIGVEPPETG
jgi:probable phosphoglycerate mutase